MKSINKSLVVSLCLILIMGRTVAQIPEWKTQFQQIIYSGSKDASTLANSYFTPVLKGFGYGFNSGWYSTAKAHSKLGVDLSLSVNLAFIPKSDDQFTFRNSDYQNLRLASGTEASLPTITSGTGQPGPDLKVYKNIGGNDVQVASFPAPQGISVKAGNGLPFSINGFGAVPTPVIQLGIGLIKNTDLKIRYVPDFSSKFDFSYWGVGLMHDIKQWIPVVKKLPFDLSVLGTYSSLTSSFPINSNNVFPGTGQGVKASMTGYSIELLVSKKISVLTVLGGFGYNKASTNFKLAGNYDITLTPPSPLLPETTTLTDPINLKTKTGGLKLTLGLRFNFGPFVMQGNYSFMGYNVLNAGIGFSIR